MNTITTKALLATAGLSLAFTAANADEEVIHGILTVRRRCTVENLVAALRNRAGGFATDGDAGAALVPNDGEAAGVDHYRAVEHDIVPAIFEDVARSQDFRLQWAGQIRIACRILGKII